jgi:hypothetical protein
MTWYWMKHVLLVGLLVVTSPILVVFSLYALYAVTCMAALIAFLWL